MGKKNLSRRQAWRISKIQQERLERAQRRESRQLPTVDDGQLGAEQTGLVIANYGAALDVEDREGKVWRCVTRRTLETVVAGDEVVWQASRDGTGVVVALSPRRRILARPDTSGNTRPIAANVDQLLIVAAPQPVYDTDLIDQYLVAAEHTQIPPVLVFNKIDLLDTEAREALHQQLKIYQTIGYPLLYISTRTAHGLDPVIAALRGKTSVFVGQSGVGKSSLVNALLPEESVQVGAISETTGHGRHTTSAARLYHLPTGGNIIDSPGVREFGLWHMDAADIAEGFIEFRPHLGRCRFRNCRHAGEPGCALQAALADGSISRGRFESFQRLVKAVETGR